MVDHFNRFLVVDVKQIVRDDTNRPNIHLGQVKKLDEFMMLGKILHFGLVWQLRHIPITCRVEHVLIII